MFSQFDFATPCQALFGKGHQIVHSNPNGLPHRVYIGVS
jgi:hypothetical protein